MRGGGLVFDQQIFINLFAMNMLCREQRKGGFWNLTWRCFHRTFNWRKNYYHRTKNEAYDILIQVQLFQQPYYLWRMKHFHLNWYVNKQYCKMWEETENQKMFIVNYTLFVTLYSMKCHRSILFQLAGMNYPHIWYRSSAHTTREVMDQNIFQIILKKADFASHSNIA